MAKRPNILFFFTDDQRFDTIQALNNPQIKTPNIDRLVGRGTSFTHAYIPGGTSAAVCMPSRAMLNSGRTLFSLHENGWCIPADHTTIGEAFRGAGYRTFGTGKWHNGADAYARSFTDGAEIFFGGMNDHWNVPCFSFDPTGKYDKHVPHCPNPWYTNEVKYTPADHVTAGKHSSELFCEAAGEWLRNYDSDDPFYMYIAFMAPHDPRTMPQQFLDMYNVDDIELPPNFMGGHPFDNGELHIRDEQLAKWPRTPEETRKHLAEYYAMITHLDDELGKVVKTLEETGKMEDTIIVFAGDNGLALGQHGLMGKQSCYEHSTRVPLIFAGPGVPEGVTTESFGYLLDIFPTLCDLVGIETPTSVEGKSLTPAMKDPACSVRESMYLAYCGMHRAVRTRTHKLIEYVVRGKHTMTQLFDLENDPWETNNLADDPAQAKIVEDLRKLMQEKRVEWNDTDTEWSKAFWDGYAS